MLKKVPLILGGLIGTAIGIFGASIFHHIINADATFITSHTCLTAVGVLGLLYFANIVYSTKVIHPRSYGVFVLGVACGIFLEAIIYFKNPCKDGCSTDFLLKLGACVILMVEGFSAFYRKPVERSPERSAD
jgi:hypothetical protein